MAEKKLFLLDGHALVYRAHYSFITRPLINSKGWNTSAISGFVRTLLDLMQNQKPTHIGVSFDTPKPTFRHEQFPAYKAQRDAQPEDITFAIPWIVKILQAMNIPIVTLDGWEADDVIGTLAKRAEKAGFTTFMVTPDKDYGQLVSPNIFVYKPGKSGGEVEIWGEKEVCERWNIKRVDQVIDILGLQGDAVDNIPGIPGIGEKTAATLLEKYDTIENLIANVSELKGKQQENVINFAEQGLLSKQLATIDINAPIEFDDFNFEIESFDRETLIPLFNELEFRALAASVFGFEQKHSGASSSDLPKSASKPAAKTSTGAGVQSSLFGDDFAENDPVAEAISAHKTIKDVEHIYHIAADKTSRESLISTLKTAETICFDTETTHIEATQADLVGISFSIKKGEAWYVPVPADQKLAQEIVDEFRPILEDTTKEIIGQNIKYDMMVLKNYGLELGGKLFDTMIAHYLVEPEMRHGMDFLANAYLKYRPVSITELIGKKGAPQGNMRDVPLEIIAEYAAEDADITFQLKEVFAPKLAENELTKLFEEMELPLVRVLADLETEGVRIDADFLKNYSNELVEVITGLEDKILAEVGFKFNIASPKQVGEVLFERLKIPYKGSKLKSGQYSTDEETLSEIAPLHPVAADILTHRGLMKLKSTYLDALPNMVNPRTGRVHSSFRQTVAATGRLASDSPNLQNIPIRTAEGRKVRMAFIPRDSEHILVSADYSQIELRLIAEIANEEAMIEAFTLGHDIHKATAAKVYGVPLEEVTSDQRRNAKTVNFSIIYGAGATNLSNQLGIKRAEAKELIENYFKTYTGLKNYMEKTVDFARVNGYVQTLSGRKRWLRDIDSRNSLARSNAERVAINTPIQGTAADLVKMAMINLDKAMKAGGFQSKMILQVHDELVFDVRRDELERLKPIILHEMTNAMPGLKVPILVEMGVGENWLEAH
jgi:DNA polymerase I